MAKTPLKTRRYAKKKGGQRTNPGVMPTKALKRSNVDDLSRLTRHVNMIIDPCNAELGPTAYRGADGIVSRFRNVVDITGTAGKTGFVYVYYPAYNTYYYLNVNAGDLVSIAALPNFAGPGQAYLLSSGDSQRAVAGCTAISYTGTELDRSGIIYSGVVPAAALGSARSVSQIVSLLQHETRTPDVPIELKWSPSAVEEEYWASGAAVPEGAGDRNLLVYVGFGLNAATTSANFTLINTFIAEWRPEAGLGLSNPNPSSHDVPGGLEKVRSVLSRMGNWWYSAAKTAYGAINSPTGKAVQAIVASMI